MTEALRYHWLRLRASCHPTEDLQRVKAAVRFAADLPADAELQVTSLEAHHGGAVQLVEATVAKSRQVREVLQRLLELPGARDDLRASVEARTDDDGVFYLRVEKQEAHAGRLVLTRGDDCVQLRLKMEHYPASRDAALASLRRMLDADRV